MKLRLQFLFNFILLLLTSSGFAQTTYIWNGSQDNTWTNPLNWTPSRTTLSTSDVIQFNTATTVTVTDVPSQTIRRLLLSGNANITLQAASGGSTLSINGPAATNNISVASGSTLGVSSGTNAFTLTFGTTASQQMDVSGTLLVNNTGTISSIVATSSWNINGTLEVNLGGTFNATNTLTTINGTLRQNGGTITATAANTTVASGGIYNHAINAGTIPTLTWNANSTVLVSGTTSIAPGGFNGQTFGNLNWNTPSQTAAVNMAMASGTFNGNFTLTNTSSGSVSFGSGAAATVAINGDLVINNGTLNLNNSGATVTTLNLAGNLIQNNGTFQRGASTGVQAINFTNAAINRNINFAGGTFNSTGIAFTVNLNAIVTLLSDVVSNQTFTVNGTLHTGVRIISGSGTFAMAAAATATLSVGDPAGLTPTGNTTAGNIRVGGTKTYSAQANYIFNGTTAQVTGIGLPTVYGTTNSRITVDNSAGVTLSQALTFNNNTGSGLTLQSGILNLDAFSLTLPSSTDLSGTFSASAMVVTPGAGQLIRGFPAAPATLVFPVGDITGTVEYSPITLNFSVLGTATNIGVRVIDSDHPVGLSTDYISRYWALTSSAMPATYTLFTTATYLPADVVGTEANIRFNQFNVATQSWTEFPTSLFSPTISSNLTNASGVIAAAFEITGRVDAPLFYRTVASGNWNDAANWEVAAEPTFASPVPAATFPTASNSVAIEVRVAHTISLTTSITLDDLTINGTVNVNSGQTVTIANGLAANDAIINGTFTNDGIFTITAPAVVQVNGTFNNTANSGAYTSTAATLFFNATSFFNHQRNGGTIPTGSWNVTSSLNITGVTNAVPAGINQAFGNFTWNCPSQSGPLSLLQNPSTVNGNYTVSGTNNQTLSMGSSAALTLNIGGDLNISGSTVLNMNAGAFVTTINLTGNFNLTGGTFTQTTTTVQQINFAGTIPTRTYTHSGGTFTATNINRALNSGAFLTLNNDMDVPTGRNFTNNGTLIMGTRLMTGAGTFTNTSAATTTLSVNDSDGINLVASGAIGNIRTGTRTYGVLANYVFNNACTSTGTGFTAGTSATFNGCAITLTSAATLSGAANALVLNNALLRLGNNNLTLSSNTSTITGTAFSNTNMVVTDGTGLLIRAFPTSGFAPFTFPVGDETAGADYAPVTYSFTAHSAATSYGVRTVNLPHPNDLPLPTDYLNRHWPSTASGVPGTYTLNVTYEYPAADVVGTEANLKVNRFITSTNAFTEYASTVGLNQVSATISAASNFIQTAFAATLRNNLGFYYRSTGTGLFTDLSIWEVSTDPNFLSPSPVAATVLPTVDNSLGVLVRSSHNVTVAAALTMDDLLVEGTLTVNSTITLTINNGTAASDATINGTLAMNGGLNLTASSRMDVNGNFTVSATTGTITSAATTLFFNGGSFYNHARNAGTIPTASWATTSTANITGITSTIPTGLAQTFGNFTWNCTGQTATLALGGQPTVVNGNYTVSGTNNFNLNMAAGTYVLAIGGDLNISGNSILNLNTSTTLATTINLTGNFNQTGGTFTQTAAFVNNLNFVGTIPTRSYTQSGGTFNAAFINRTINLGAFLTLNSNIDVPTGRTFTNNGTLIMGSQIMAGAGTFNNASAATTTLSVNHPDGINLVATGAVGSIRTGVRTYGAAANYVFNSACTSTGTGFTAGTAATFNGCTLALTSAASLSGAANALVLNNAVLSLGINNLTLSNTAATITGASFSASNMIATNGTGSLIRNFPAGASSFTFPIGDASGTIEYTPVAHSFLSANAAGTLSARVEDVVHPNNGGATDHFTRFFVFNITGAITYTYTLSTDFVNDDIVGTLGNIALSRWNGTIWTPYPTSISGNTASVNGTLSNVTAPLTATSHFAGRTNSLLYYRSISSGNWTNTNTWETSPFADFSSGVVSPALAAPTSGNALGITIQSAHTVTINSAVTSAPLFVDGTLEMQTGGSFSTLASAQFNSTGVYIHNQNGGTIPSAVWNAASHCRITGTTTTAPGGMVGQTFGRFTYEATGQTAASLSLGLTATVTTFNGDFTIETTGTLATNILTLAAASATVNMNGKLIVNGGTLLMNSAAAATTLTVADNLEINGGTFNLTNSTTAQVLNIGGNYLHAGGTLNNTGSGLSTITFTGANKTYNQSGGTVTNTNINYAIGATGSLSINSAFTLQAARTFTVATGGTLTLGNDIVVNGAFTNNGTLVCGTRLMTGTGSFTLANAATATLSVGDPGGLSPNTNTTTGNIRVSGTKTYNSSANIIYNGTAAQVTGTGLATTWGAANTRITFDNPAGVSLSQALTINNNAGSGIDLLNGRLSLGNFNLTLNTLPTLTGTFSSANMIVTDGTGVLQRSFATGASTLVFPIGDNTSGADYSPVTFAFSTLGTATTLGIRVVDARDPNDVLSTDYLTRHWVITSSAAPASYDVNATFSYVAADVVGTEANIKLNRFNPAAASLNWTEFVSNAASNSLTANLTNTTGFLLATTFTATGRVNAALHYRSVAATGTWSTPASWEVSTDPLFTSPAPVAASASPNDVNSASITIQSGHTMNVTAAQTADDVTVEGTLSVNGVTFTLANGAATFDMVVNGTLRNSGTGAAVTTSGVLQVNGTYEHALNAGTVPTATWTSGSTCLITGVTVNQPGGLNQAFHHFTWNCPSQGNAVSMLLTGTNNWGGDFRVVNTGTPTARELRLTGAASTLNLAGSLLVEGGIFVTQNAAAANTMNITGDVLVSGTGNFAGISTSGGTTAINLSGNFQVAATATLSTVVTNTSTAVTVNMLGVNKLLGSASGFPTQGYSFSVNNPAAEITLSSNVIVGSSRTFNVNTGRLNMGTNRISGNGSFTLANANTATLSTGDPDGLVLAVASPLGAIRTLAARTFGAQANYVFTGSNQVIGTPIVTPPFVCNSLTINSPNRVTLTQNVNVTTNLNLLGGLLELDNFNLGLLNTNNAAAITGNTPSATNMVTTSGTGRLFKSFATGGPQTPFVYPVGDRAGTSEYSPMTLTLLSNTAAGTIGLHVKDIEHPNNGGAVDYLSRYWSFASTGVSTYTYSANFTYLPADVEGDINNIAGARWNGSSWSSIESTTASNTLTLTANPLSNTTAPLNGNDFTGRTSQFVYFFRTLQSGNWNDVNTWQVATDAGFTTPVWPAPFAPTAANSESVLIRSGHVVTVTNNVSIDQLSMDNTATSTLTINSGVDFTLLDGPGTDFVFSGGSARININGTFINQGTQSGTQPSVFVGPNAVYEHAQNGGVVYTATWNATATCLISGTTSTTPTGISGQTFGNFTWNTPGMTLASTTALLTSTTTFNGDFTLANTGSATNTVLLASAASAITTNFNGSFLIQNGTLNLSAGSVAHTFNLVGNYNQTGGTLTHTSTAASTFNFTGTNPARTYTQNGGSTVVGTNINRTVATGAFLTLNNDIDVATSRSFVNNGTLIMGQRLITGAGSFTHTSVATATLSIGDVDGITVTASGAIGNIRTTAARTYGVAANYIYTSTAQNTGNGLTAANSLTFDGPTIALSNSVTLSSTATALTLNNALVSLGNNNLTLSNATSTLAGSFGNSNMIITNGTGQLIRQIPTSAFANPYIFPVGGASGYSPVLITFTASAGGNLGARVTEGTHPNMLTPPVADYLNRFWNFTTSMSSYTYSGVLQYQDGDVVGNESLLLNSQFDGVSWNGIPSIVDAADNSLYFPGSGTLTHLAAPLTSAFTYSARNTPVQYHYRTVANGNWNDPAIWEISTDAAFLNPLPVPASVFPDAYNSLSILIRNGHQVAANTNVDLDQLTIDNNASNSRLTIDAGVELNLIDGSGNDLTLNTNSRLNVNGTLHNAGQISGSSAITTNFFASSEYEHNQNGGIVPTATWNATSTCLISGTTSTTPTGISGQTFGNFTWDTPGMTMPTTTAILAAATTFNGNFRVVSTGTPATNALLLSSAAITTTINGDLLLEGGTLNLVSAAVAQTINLLGNYNQTGGTFTQTGTTVSTLNLNGVNRSYTQSGGTVVNTNINYQVNAASAVITLNNGIDIASGRNFNVNIGRLNLGTNLITGAGSFTLASVATATLGIGHQDGIALLAAGAVGNIRTSNARTYGVLANYVFTSTAQNTGSGFVQGTSATFDGCTLNLSVNATVSGTTNALTLNNALLSLGSNNLTLSSSSATIAGTFGNTNMIVTDGTGQFLRQIPTSAFANPYVFPIGAAGVYSPMSISFSSNSSAGLVGGRIINTIHPSIGASTDYISRYWRTTSTLGNYAINNFTLGYEDAIITGNEADLVLSGFTGSSWFGIPTTNNTVANTITAPQSGTIDQAALPLNNFDYTGRNTLILFYRTVASGNWNDAAIWETSPNSGFTPASPATVPPNADNSVSILVRNGHVVQVTANTDADQLTVDNTANSTININSGVDFTLRDGIGNDLTLNTASRLFINGTLVNKGQITGSTATTTIVNNAGVYQHDLDGGSIPTATWNAGSFNSITGVVLTAPTNFAQTFHHVDWNCPSQNAIVALTGTNNPVGVNGDFTVFNSGSTFGNDIIDFSGINRTWTGNLVLKGGRIFLNRGASTTATLAVNNFAMDGTATANYQFVINNSTAVSSTSTFTVNGAFTLSPSTNVTNSGVGFFNWGSNISGQTSNLNVVGNITHTNGLVTGFLSTYNLNINGAGTRTLTSISNLANGININVNSPAVLNLGTQTLNNTQIFTLANGAGLIIGSPDGISTTGNATGNILSGGTRTYGATANYTYAGLVPQITGNALTAANILTINNAAGVTTSVPVNAASLNLTSGILSTSSSALLTLTTTAVIAGTPSATACVSGPMVRQIPINQSSALTLLYPLGKAGSYNPFEIVNPTTGAIGVVSIQAEVFNANSGGTGGPGFTSLNTNRYWSASITSGAPNLTNTGAVRLTETSPALVAGVNAIGQSATVNGTYAFKGGNVSVPTVTNTSVLNPGYGFFTIGVLGPISCPSPVLTVGVGEAFNNLTDLAAVLNGTPINCNLVVELTNNYTSASEIWPVAFNQFTYGVGGPFTVTIRPANGTTALVSGASATQLLNFNGADNLILDGRQGGAGAPHNLVFNNTNASGSTIQFINDAQNNIIRFADIIGSASSTTSGVIVIGTSSSGTGNDNIQIENNLINGGVTRPANLIYAAGSATRDNNAISLSNNNFFNWGLSSTAASSAVSINANNHSWTISGNSFYLPATWTTAGNIFGINVSATSAANSGFTINGNFIGGNGPSLGSNFWTVNTGSDYRFCGIAMNVSTTGTNTVQNNSISNFSIVSGTSFQTQSSAFSGIFAQGGAIDIVSNTIGGTTQGYDIMVTPTGSPLANIHGIYHTGNVGINISSNQIIGIQTNGSMNSLYGIRASTSAISGTMNITNNQIGAPVGGIALNNNSGVSYSGSGSLFTAGIHVTGARPATISGNFVKDITFTTDATSGGGGSNRTIGIYREDGSDNVIQNNTVRNIRSTSQFSGAGVNAMVAGINANVTTGPGILIAQNTVHSIESATTSPTATTANGISVASPATSVVNQSLFSDNFSSGGNWTLNVVTGAEGGAPNPWEIGTAVSCNPYPGGTCGASNSRGLYIRCADFLCDLIGGGCPVFNASSAANNTNRAAHLNTNISTISYSNISLNFAWRCAGATSAYGQVRYSTDGGSTWTDLPTQYRSQTAWQCANVSLPAACENIPNLRIGFKWINGTAGSDPPMIITNVEVRGDLQSSSVSLTERNNVHSVVNLSGSASAIASGIQFVAGTNLAYNNLVRMGIRPDGNSQSNGTIVNGINVTAGNATLFHNSVYVGGTGVSGSANSFALFSNSTGTVSSTNNILVNARSNGAGTGKHYVHRFNTLTSLASDYNLLFASGNGAVLGAIGGTDYNFLPNWHLITGRDINSVTGNPQFVNATGDASSVDLHIQSGPTPIESAGTPLSAVSIDYDGDARASNTPVDIGADAGLFTPVDLTPPAITFTPIPLQAICSGTTTTTLQVNITDNQSGLSLSNNLPRLFFRRSVGAPTTAWSNTNAVVGTYVSGTSQNSTWQFVIDYAAFGITPAGANQFEYYVVAQDQAPTVNIGYSQTNGSSPVHTNTANQTVAPSFAFGPSGTFSFGAIPLSGTVTVGAAGNYPRFNGTGGLFEAINTNGLGGDLEVLVISDINEGTNWTPLNAQNEFCGSNYTITIRPNAATLYTIEANSSAANALFSFYGARRVIVDGRFNGAGRFLRLRHNRTTTIFASTVEYNFGANNNVLRNCIIEGQNRNNANSTTGSVGVVRIGGSMGFASGNLNDITIENNQIRNLSNVAQTSANTPLILIYCGGASSNSNINNITITQNELFNFSESAIQAFNGTSVTTNSIGNNFTITGNHVYQAFNIPTYQYPIWLDALGNTFGHVISGNRIGGSANPNPDITGTWTNNKVDGEVVAIYANVGDAPTQAEALSIQGNKIQRINISGTGWTNFVGIRVQNGRVRIGDEIGNVIGSEDNSVDNIISNGSGGSFLSEDAAVMGIWTQSGEEVVIENNIISGLSTGLGTFCFFDGIAHGSNLTFNGITYNAPGGKSTIRNNVIANNRSSSNLSNSAVSNEGMISLFLHTNSMDNLVEGNLIQNNGCNATVTSNVRNHGVLLGILGQVQNHGGIFRNNTIAALANANVGAGANPAAEINGLVLNHGNWQVSNNMISLRNGTTGTHITNRNTFLIGIRDHLRNLAGQGANYYHNSVYVYGTNGGSGTPNPSYCYLRFPNNTGSVAGAPIQLRNNLFVNDRSGIGTHRAIGNVNSSVPATNWNSSASDYNFFSTLNASTATRWGTTDYNLNNWQTISGGDANTDFILAGATTIPATQLLPTDLFETDYLFGNLRISLLNTDATDFIDNQGTFVAAVSVDIDNDSRDPVAPDIGSDEFNLCAAPLVTTPPANQTLCEGLNTSFTVANSGQAPFTYQWQLSTDGGTSWNNLSNGGVYSGVDATTLNLTAVPFSLNANQYRVVITNTCGNTTSVAATLTVNQPPQITAYSPPSFVNNVCALSNTGFGVTATGTGLSYQWEVSTDGGTSWNNVVNDANYSGATAASMFISNTPASFHEHQYRVVVSGTCPSPVTSLVGALNVGQVTLNTQPPASTVACAGAVATITVGATGNDLAYQWQISTNNGVSFSPLSNSGVYSGVDTETLTMTGVTVGMNNYQYRVLIGSVACPTVTSSASALTVNPLLATSVSIAASPGNVICDGTSVTFTASPVNGGLTPSYQWLLNGNPVGTNASTYLSSSLADGDVITVEMTSSATCPIPATATSNTITMTVNPILPASVSISTASTTVCQGSNITFTATPVNGGATPSYAWTINGNPAGTNSPTFSTTALANGDVVEVVMTSSEACVSGSPASSNSIAMTVQFVGQWLGFTSDWNTSSNWGCGVLPTITTVVNLDGSPVGGNQPVVSSSLTALVRDLNMAAGSSVNINPGADLSVYGNIDNQGNPSFGSGTIIFAGNDLHSVGGANILSIGSVVVNNAAPGLDVQLNQSLTISNSLNMTAGTLDLNGFDIDLGTSGELLNETNTNRVLGAGEIRAQRTLAASTTYTNIAGLGASITTDATAPGFTLVERGHESQAVSSNNSIRRYYDINPAVNTGLNATLRIAYFDDDLSDIDGIDPSENQLIPWRSTDNGLTWEGQHFPTRITNDAAANWVQLTQIPAFSRWTLSDWLTEPLPVELLYFNATASGNVVNLNWATASEINNDYFTVERSKDAQQFEAVLQREGAGNSNAVLNYSDVDPEPFEGLSYYRLKQTDFNGEFSYSEVVPVYFGGLSTSSVNAWVNAEGQIVANIRSRFSDQVQLELFDIAGRKVYTQQAGLTEGSQQLFIQPGQLSEGVYLLSIRGKHIEHMQKMMIK